MTDRPIIFSDLMIRALIEGRKTQTRRVLNRLTRFGAIDDISFGSVFGYDWHFRDKKMCRHNLRHGELTKALPYAPGDRLWVREAWAKTSVAPIIDTIDNPWFVYREYDSRCDYGGPWKPSIHMPRAASRLTLTVTDVRVQRLQDISNTEARAEGAVDEEWDQWREDVMNVAPGGSKIESERDSFSYIWDSLNEKRGYGWDSNPWVVALTFDVQQQNIDHMRDAA